MTDNETFPDTWCRMWSGETALAHELIAPGGRQWSGQTDGLDALVGPGPAEAFIAGYHQRNHHRYQARTLVLAGDLVAYSWDVTLADGTRKTGTDVNVLRDGLVVENWTIVGPHDDRPDLEGSGSADLAAVVSADVARRGVSGHREPVLDPRRQTAAYLWEGGVELLVVRDGTVARRTSIAAERPFAY